MESMPKQVKQDGAEMVRINTRIGKTLNDWLDNESRITGVPKSTFIHLALEQYVQQRKAIDSMVDIGSLLETVNKGFKEIEEKIERLNTDQPAN